jgi:hypothetical protein
MPTIHDAIAALTKFRDAHDNELDSWRNSMMHMHMALTGDYGFPMTPWFVLNSSSRRRLSALTSLIMVLTSKTKRAVFLPLSPQ